MKRILNNAVALIVVMIVLLLIIPLNTFLIDVMIILNISISLVPYWDQYFHDEEHSRQFR